jgi:hypothetical protein
MNVTRASTLVTIGWLAVGLGGVALAATALWARAPGGF